MELTKLRKTLIIIVGIVIFLFASLYIGAFSSFDILTSTTQLASANTGTGVLPSGAALIQKITIDGSSLDSFILHISEGSYASFDYTIEVNDQAASVERITGEFTGFIQLIEKPIDVQKGDILTLTITVNDGNTVGFYYGNSIKLARGEIELQDLNEETCLYLNGQMIYGKLACDITTTTPYYVKLPFFLLSGVSILLTGIWAIHQYQCAKKRKNTLSIRGISAFSNYWFLMGQMISRDFKIKYKRSALGVLWSFLNPLLTMAVQYLVFSTLFKSSIPYYPVYLLSGIICYSYFCEGAGNGLLSITGNTSLLTKVYIPKYIFPVSRTLSSGINFILSLIPLFAVAAISGLPITEAYLLLPFVFLCLLMLIIGFALMLGTMMVFFRDIQFLWTVIVMMIVYATPIFYPETILPLNLLPFFKLNPLYHVIRLFRYVLLRNFTLEPVAYVYCFLICAIPLLFGLFVFKKNQDKFLLYL